MVAAAVGNGVGGDVGEGLGVGVGDGVAAGLAVADGGGVDGDGDGALVGVADVVAGEEQAQANARLAASASRRAPMTVTLSTRDHARRCGGALERRPICCKMEA